MLLGGSEASAALFSRKTNLLTVFKMKSSNHGHHICVVGGEKSRGFTAFSFSCTYSNLG